MNSERKKSLEKTYETLINVALQNHPLSEIMPYIDDNFMGYGSALDEKLHGWGSVKWMIDRQRRELAGQKSFIKRYPVENIIFGNDASALFVEEIEITVDLDEEKNGFTLRLSTLLEYVRDNWMIRHFHGSTADADTPEGSAWPIEEWKRRNAELQRAVDDKTTELQNRNRELEIEASLERVRARAMGMQSSDELADLIITIFKELQKLDMELTRCLLWVFNDEDKSATIWMTNSEDPNQADDYQVPCHDHPAYNSFLSGWQNRQQKWEYDLNGKNKERWDEILLYGYFNKLPEHIKHAMKDPERVILSGSFNKYGIIQTAGLDRLSDPNQDILQRFSQVFEQTYTRFLDLQKAEAQAREAKIETALEKVRSRTMAMQRSAELQQTAALMFDQIESLDVHIMGCGFNIWNDDKSVATAWMSGMDRFQPPFQTSSSADIFQRIYIAMENGESLFVEEQDGEALEAHYKYMASIPVFQIILEQIASKGLSAPSFQIMHCAYFSHGYLMFITLEKCPDDHEIFRRFAKVFEQTYTRFLDLKKAEAQAREAQIEAALERTRAQSMMMQHSDEINQVSNIFHEQLLVLGLASEFSYVWLPDVDNLTHLFWATWSDKTNAQFTTRSKACSSPLDPTEPYTADCLNMWQSGEAVHVVPVLSDEVETFFSAWPELVDEVDTLKAELFPDGLYYAEAYMKYGCFGIHIRRTPDDAEKDILHRFAVEFERAYTRFLDLKKAEAQALKIKMVNQENERLLHSILPQPIAEQIRTGGQNVVKRFEEVSILFADIVGFTILSEKLSAGKVVDILNGLFSEFDDLTDHYHLEKIKTIGDAYMVAAGVPEERADHARILFHFAQDMLQSLEAYNQAHDSQLNLRIGMSSGPVVAGVIGKKKFAYDLWGDSVNTAARMEAYGRQGKIQVSSTSYELLKNDYSFERIPGVEIKGKGKMDVYVWLP